MSALFDAGAAGVSLAFDATIGIVEHVVMGNAPAGAGRARSSTRRVARATERSPT